MIKKMLWILVALMSFMTVSCSSDDDNEPEKPIKYEPKDGKVSMGGEYGRDIPYEPIDVEDLPEWLQIMIDRMSAFYIVCEGSWDGQRVYFCWCIFMSSFGGFYSEDGTLLGLYELNQDFVDNGGWEGWKCIVYNIPPSD